MALQPLFNPSNDMALAANVRQYFPPSRIRQMESDLASLSRLWPEGPWGWSLATKQRYLALGVGREELPSDEWLHEVRRLSSRQFGVAYYQAMDGLMAGDEAGSALLPCRARYCNTMAELAAALEACPVSIIKAPWSSSGRGNMVVGRSDEDCDSASQRGRLTQTERQRAEGLIRQQGGLVVEPFYADKALGEFFDSGKRPGPGALLIGGAKSDSDRALAKKIVAAYTKGSGVTDHEFFKPYHLY